MTAQHLTHSLAVGPQALDDPIDTMSAEESATAELSHDGRPVRVAIVAGGLTHERDVSIRSGRRVAGYLATGGAQVRMYDLDDGLMAHLREFGPDLVWPLVHGSTGEDGTLQSLLDVVGMPFVGSTADACRLASDKPVAKAVLARAGLAVPDGFAFPQSMFRELGARTLLDAVVERLGLPLVVKPAAGGSALGVTMVHERGQLPNAMVDAFSYGDVALIEKLIHGVELAVSVVDTGGGPRALPPVEIVTHGAYDYDARYNPGRSEYFVPGRLGDEQRRAVEEFAVRVHEELGLRHLSRTDLVLDEDGIPWFLDCNVAPGMTETSLLPQAGQATGGRLADLYLDIVRTALADARG